MELKKGPKRAELRKREEPAKLPDQIANALREEISTGALLAGSRLPTERELCIQFRASRSAVREAISKLKYDGMVETRQGSGAYVAASGPGSSFRIDLGALRNRKELQQVFELRITMESAAAAMAATRRTQKHLRQIQRALDAMNEAIVQGQDAVPSDTSFHLAIAEATGNEYFKDFMAFLEGRLRRSIAASRTELERDTGRARDVHAEHLAIYRAIESRDPERARAAALLHLNHAAEELGLLPFEPRRGEK